MVGKLSIAVLGVISAALLASAQQQAVIPRPEYPQPQFQRADWQTLNGEWQFEFDDKNAGLDENWGAGSRTFSRRITVPFAFESKLSGIGDTSFHPWVWYRRTIDIPQSWKGRRILLRFGAVDYHATVWVNGQKAGEHEGGHTPFALDVTPLLKSGGNTVTVRAFDPPTDRYIPRGKQYWEPQSRSIFYTRTSGIWQPVWIEAVGESYLETVRITPTLDGTVRFDARVLRPQPNLELVARIKYRDAEIATASAPVSGPRATIGAVVMTPRLWSVGSPNLYDVTFELRAGGTTLDRVSSYFGFREIGVEGNRMTLNRRPIYIKMVLDQGYWPDGILTPPTDEAIQYDIRVAKEMGFNGARKHQKVEDQRFLYWADRMGFLVSGEMANAYLFDDQYVGRFTREWLDAVERDYNHPSIVMWVPINESWGVPNLRDPRQANHLKSLYTMTRSLDATRPVIDNDGWEHTDMTDLFAIHDYAGRGEQLYEKYKDLGKPGVPVPDNAFPVLIPGYKYNGTPVLLSEFGGIAFIPPGHQVPKESWGYSGVEKTPEAALARLRGLYEAIAKIPAFGGLCYTQLTDVEQEVNGLLTYDRKMKFEAKEIKAINDLVR
jgi:beta-galactosidase/beta-glucuronidase